MKTPITSLALVGPLLALCSMQAGAQEIYATDFSTLDGWTVQTGCAAGYAWAADATPATLFCGPSAFRSAPASLNFNDGVDIGGAGIHGGAAVTCGEVSSPPIDLGPAGASATLSFWVAFEMETGCQWDELRLIIRPAGGGTAFFDECIVPQLTICNWQEFELPLDPQWGNIEIAFGFDTLDDWANGGAGPFIDDLRISGACAEEWSLQCVGSASVATGIPAALVPGGSFSVATNTFQLDGEFFPANTFATAFYGAQPGTITLGNGVRCIAAAQSFRLSIAPTRALGRPHWNVDLGSPPLAAGQILAGSTWLLQAVYRDGASFNFSDAVRVTFCD